MSKSVEITYDKELAETEAAIYFRIGDDDVWIPKSTIEDHDLNGKTFTVPEWLALDKGLDAFID